MGKKVTIMTQIVTPEQINAILNRRFATKKYNPDKHIPDQDWETILAAGRLSPSSNGYEPWQFLLIKSPQIKADIRSFAPGAINSLNGADKLLIILARKGLTYDSAYAKEWVEQVQGLNYDPNSPQSQGFKVFQSQLLKLTTPERLFSWTCRQCYIALANMTMTAAALDIDSCPIEGFNYEKMNQYLADHQLIDPQAWGVAVMCSFGYRDQAITPKKRWPLAKIYREI
jgi:nitroreductase